jgi:hypothetical protein
VDHENEVIETAAELVELYNPADILQAFADAQAEDIGIEDAAAGDEGEDVGAGAARVDDAYAAAADQWAAGQPEVPEARDEQTAAAALYGLALDFQDRSQRTEGGLIEGFENAATSLLGLVGTLVIVDDDDEHLSLGTARVPGPCHPRGRHRLAGHLQPDQIVRYYDPTDVFGDLAEAIADAYPAVAGDAGEEAGDDAEDDAHEDDAHEDDAGGDEARR